MATRAVAPKIRAPKKSGPESPFKRWWQQILFYTAFAVALVTAGPSWIDKVRGFNLGVRSASEAELSSLLWARNPTCGANPGRGFLSPRNVAVDATICDSGDILVRAVNPQNPHALPIFKWLPLDDVVRTNAVGGFIPTAQAATLSANGPRSKRTAAQPAYKVAWLQSVICTRVNGRFLIRRINVGSGCVDEVIDTFTGAVVSRNPAPCTPQC